MSLLAAVAALAAFTARASAAPDALSISTQPFVSPSTAAYAGVRGEIRSIAIQRRNVFDLSIPGEDWEPFRIANKVHIQTKEGVIRREILLRPGDSWDSLKGLESERNLRATSFIRKAEVVPKQGSPGEVDLLVRSQDSWTTLPQLSVGTEGGDNYLIYGMEEDNLLGYGKSVSYFHAQVGPQTGNELRYDDPRLQGSRYHFTSLYGTATNGDTLGALVERPFFALDTPYAVRALWARVIQQDTLYQDAATLTKFIQEFRTVDSEAGALLPASAGVVQRGRLGFHYEHDRFDQTSDTVGSLPQERELSGPTVGYSLIRPDYIKETYIDKMARVEDFNLGDEFSVTAGAMMKSLGSDADRWTLSAVEQRGQSLGEGRFALGQAGVNGRLRGQSLENSIFFANVNLFWKTVWLVPQTWVVHTEWNTTKSLDGENQLVLGGNTGLRGYKNDSFTGARSTLTNFEDRFFLTHEFFHLFLLGGAAFADTGAVAQEGASLVRVHFKSDVGVGLRLAPTRSTSGGVIRLDVAYALNSGPGPSRWVVSLRGGQAFQIFNSTNREAVRTPATAISESDAGDRLRRQ